MAQMIRGAYCYAKLEGNHEDEEEKRHRRAQYLIYKTMEKADSLLRKRPLPLRIRVCRRKMSKKMKRLRSRLQFAVSFLKVGFYGQLTEAIASLNPACY
uniref:Uncharacterized protein n=1 Tax=Nymphaea colorata TaxID=210225 RepID=A0A5K1F5M1_9MAGN|nr:unnamed protein product [Nymphaea colorata]